MSERDYLCEFKHLVIMALLRLEEGAYGVTVRQENEFQTGREAIGAIYATLHRLQREGRVKSHPADPAPERGGRSKRFFPISATGLAAVKGTRGAPQRASQGFKFSRSYS